MFFDSWSDIRNILVTGILFYPLLILVLRISGKRTLAQMNAFDMVITMAIGSILASTVLSGSTPLLNGLTALVLLVALQYLVALGSVHSKAFRNLIKAEPTLLFYEGRMIDSALKKERVLEEEVRAAIRAGGHNETSDVKAVILETDGSFTILPSEDVVATAALNDVPDFPEANTTKTA